MKIIKNNEEIKNIDGVNEQVSNEFTPSIDDTEVNKIKVDDILSSTTPIALQNLETNYINIKDSNNTFSTVNSFSRNFFTAVHKYGLDYWYNERGNTDPLYLNKNNLITNNNNLSALIKGSKEGENIWPDDSSLNENNINDNIFIFSQFNISKEKIENNWNTLNFPNLTNLMISYSNREHEYEQTWNYYLADYAQGFDNITFSEESEEAERVDFDLVTIEYGGFGSDESPFNYGEEDIDAIERAEREKYYGDADIVPTNPEYFTYEYITDTDDIPKSAILTGIADDDNFALVTDLVIPYKCTYTDETGNSYQCEVIGIGESAFYMGGGTINHIIRKVTIPTTITDIGKKALQNCIALTDVVMLDGLINIGDQAFCQCYNLENITIPDSVTRIGDYAFYNCESLININIPKNIVNIGDYAFHTCDGLKSIDVDEENDWFSSSDGVLFNKDKTCLIQYPMSKENTSFIIPDSVVSIGKESFWFCSNLKSITIPDSVTSIGEGAFYGINADIYCKWIYVGESSRQVEIDNGDFISAEINNKINFNYIDQNDIGYDTEDKLYWRLFDDGELIIGGNGEMRFFTPRSGTGPAPWNNEDTYRSIKKLTVLDGVKLIFSYAFHGCSNLEDIQLSDSVEWVGKGAFYDTAYYNNDSNWRNGVLYICNHLIKAKDSIDGAYIIGGLDCPHVKSISPEAFYECKLLSNIIISNNVKYIGESAFRFCTSLSSVAIPENTTILGGFAFANCTSLYSVVIGNSIEIINPATFFSCAALEEIHIPISVTNIGFMAFNGCNKLANIYYAGTSYEWDSIEINRDDQCENETILAAATKTYLSLTNGTCGDNVKWRLTNDYTLVISGNGPIADRGASSNYYPWGSYVFSIGKINIEEGITVIPQFAFSGCTALSKVSIPDNVLHIGSGAFLGCRKLTTITLGKRLHSISDAAFQGCPTTTLTFGSSVKVIGATAFATNDNIIDEIHFYGKQEDFNKLDKSYLQNYNKLTCYGNESDEDNWGVKCGDNATWSLINETLTISGEGPMWDYIQGTSPWYENRLKITEIIVENGITRIGNYAFYLTANTNLNSNGYLASIQLPETLKEIGSYAFYGCKTIAIEEFTIPPSVECIESYAFSESFSGAFTVNIYENIKKWGENVFSTGAIVSKTFYLYAYSGNLGGFSDYINSDVSGVTCHYLKDEPSSLSIDNTDKLNTNMGTIIGMGSCGTNSFWTMYRSNSGNTLIIEGCGEANTWDEYEAFRDSVGADTWDNITTIKIGDYIESIENAHFNISNTSCVIYINSNVKKISSDTFGCSPETTIQYNGIINDWLSINTDYKQFLGTLIVNKIESDQTDGILNISVNRIPEYAFSNIKVKLKGSETDIETYNLINVLEIGDYAFADNKNFLTTIKINYNVENIGDYAFIGSESLKCIKLKEDFSKSEIFTNNLESTYVDGEPCSLYKKNEEHIELIRLSSDENITNISDNVINIWPGATDNNDSRTFNLSNIPSQEGYMLANNLSFKYITYTADNIIYNKVCSSAKVFGIKTPINTDGRYKHSSIYISLNTDIKNTDSMYEKFKDKLKLIANNLHIYTYSGIKDAGEYKTWPLTNCCTTSYILPSGYLLESNLNQDTFTSYLNMIIKIDIDLTQDVFKSEDLIGLLFYLPYNKGLTPNYWVESINGYFSIEESTWMKTSEEDKDDAEKALRVALDEIELTAIANSSTDDNSLWITTKGRYHSKYLIDSQKLNEIISDNSNPCIINFDGEKHGCYVFYKYESEEEISDFKLELTTKEPSETYTYVGDHTIENETHTYSGRFNFYDKSQKLNSLTIYANKEKVKNNTYIIAY